MLFFIYIFAKELKDNVEDINDYTDFNMLLAIQMLMPRTDSKEFVDRPTKRPLKEIIKKFRKIEEHFGIKKGRVETTMLENAHNVNIRSESDLKILTDFLNENFYPVGIDITYHLPIDYTPAPKFIDSFKNEELKKIGLRLNEIWKDLSRKKANLPPESETTLLNLPHPFMIPGGRFREFYYWDTYFILEGLLVCDMKKTAINILNNFIYILDTLGYIPNGTRKYYKNRTQPPFFPLMLLKLLNANEGFDFNHSSEFKNELKNESINELILGKGLEMAVKENEFFDKYKSVTVKGKDGKMHKLNYFHVPTNFPRPESFGEDIETYEHQHQQSSDELFTNLKSGAESGWDFSSRWLIDEKDLSTIAASQQIPVDLNAILYRGEVIISKLYKLKGDEENAKIFSDKAEARKLAINQVLWNPLEGTWMDYNIKTESFPHNRFYFSNITPLVYGIQPPGENNSYDILRKYKAELFSYEGGVPASGPGVDTGQQWDFPNAWAPHQHMLVELLISMNEDEMAYHAARSFFNSAYIGFKSSNTFFEKYSVLNPGFTGGGGEYEPQEGFGWTNGVILAYLKYFGDKLLEQHDHIKSYEKISGILDQKASFQSKYSENMISSFFGLHPGIKAK